ncbi:SAM-dependent methyltransferase [Cecembia calidifontis]|jgi:SAM-dependent methyltransferase|uniref:Thiopurine S-methyltransferase n=1 Tax=Cecembia calidifontis TaxID=1187080 RepID=A0A4Q7PCQ1_9BACT|nr:SAM-dependent methyltransferase [Cecembia calidifontis]RZS98111.1 thiopurine S-methyltransferase [Cecembia calidifontis]
MFLDEAYWTNRYNEKSTGWDIGSPSTPLKQYLDQISNKDLKILIPGAGNAYEAVYAFGMGFEKVHILDFSPVPIAQFKKSCPDFPVSNIFLENFFSHEGKYDLILEQTFFCALDPQLRKDYVRKMHDLLLPGGKLTGVMFAREFAHEGPPFGGSKEEYSQYFMPEFEILKLEPCYNSIPPRQGSELFVQLRKN